MSLRTASTIKCYNHPHRPANQRCSRCGLHCCEECLQTADEQLLCPTCRYELSEAKRIKEEMRVPFWVGVRRAVTSFVLFVAIAGVVLAVIWRLGLPLLDRSITEEELDRIRDAYELQLGDVNWLSARRDGRVISITSEQPGYESGRLIDRRMGDGFVGWRSADATFPQEIVLAMANPRPIRVIRVIPASDAPTDSWAREVEIFTALDLNGPWDLVARAELSNEKDLSLPTFFLESTGGPGPTGRLPIQYVKVVIHSNWGSPDFVSLGEIEASGM